MRTETQIAVQVLEGLLNENIEDIKRYERQAKEIESCMALFDPEIRADLRLAEELYAVQVARDKRLDLFEYRQHHLMELRGIEPVGA